MLAVPVQAGSQAWVMVRASGADAGQQLELDGFEVRFSASGNCSN
jgi:hypothetical protein